MSIPRIFLRSAQCKWIQVAAALWLSLGTAAAHDFWIEPANFRPKAGEKIPLKLIVGQDFKGDSVLYLPETFERYTFVGAAGEQPVAGRRGDEPAGSIVAVDGRQVVGFHSKKFEITFDEFDEFEAYLLKEGLERNLVAARHKSSGKILEIYSREAKALIGATRSPDAAPDHVFGFPLELVAQTDPYRQRELRVQLLYQGRPLEGALIVAFNKTAPTDKLKVRTDREGHATLALTGAGAWLVTSVHMIPRPWYTRGDWESFWASLTFELP